MEKSDTGFRVLDSDELEFVAGGFDQQQEIGDGGSGPGGDGTPVYTGPWSVMPIPDGWRLDVPLDNSFSIFVDRGSDGSWTPGFDIDVDDVGVQVSYNPDTDTFELKIEFSDDNWNYEIKLKIGDEAVPDPLNYLKSVEGKKTEK